MKHVTFIYNSRRSEAALKTRQTAEWLKEQGVEVMLLEQPGMAALGELPLRTDLVVTMGGDGTLLTGARLAATAGVPVLGVHLGRFGFIAQIPPEQVKTALGQWLRGQYQIQERLMVQAWIENEEGRIYGLNEIALLRTPTAPMLNFRIEINDSLLTSYPADGSLVATPTGSTGYALSAGSPVIHPEVEALILVPISPHTLGARPLVLPPDVRITITIEPDTQEDVGVTMMAREAQLTADGNRHRVMQPGQSVHITQAPIRTRLLVFNERDFFEKLRNRLLWGARVNE